MTRGCIEQYIKQRTIPDYEAMMGKVKALRDKDFADGYSFVIENIEKLGYAALEQLAYYPDRSEDRLFDLLEHGIASKIYCWDEDRDEIKNVRYIVSYRFLAGMEEAAKELIEKSN